MTVAKRLAGWLPAVILPVATFDQFWIVIRTGSSENVSALTWTLFLFANLGALCLGRPEDRVSVVQMGLAFGLTALLDLAIVVVIVMGRISTA